MHLPKIKPLKNLFPRSVSKGSFLDGKKVKKLLKDEPEFDKFLSTYFDLLDDDKSGSLSRHEMKPALVRFGELVGLPPAGTTAEADELVDRMFTTLMSDNLSGQVDRASFITVLKEFLKSVSAELEAKPLLVEVYDGTVLRELAENPELFGELVRDIFREFDEDGSGTLSRLELKPAIVSLGLVPPTSKPETDAMLSRVIGKYGGSDLVVDAKEFEQMMRDVVRDLGDALRDQPIILSADKKPALTGTFIRNLTNDKYRFQTMADQLFIEWDILRRGRLSRTEIAIGFRKYASSFECPLLSPSEAERLCDSVFRRADEDDSGFVEIGEFEGVLLDLLNGMARKLDTNPVFGSGGSAKSGGSSTGSFFSWVAEGLSGASSDAPAEPVKRTADEIKAAHGRKTAAEAAAEAKNKLEERGKKISMLNELTEDLEAETANFADLTAQLNKKMQKKWW